MSSVIYYFSATGNSLLFARTLAANLGDTELCSIPKSMGGAVPVDAERVGLVFPVHIWGLPRTVADFLNRLKVSDAQYVFAVATGGGLPANTLYQARSLLRRNGGHLDAGFAVREPSYLVPDESAARAIGIITKAAHGVQPRLGAERLPEITEAVRRKLKSRPESSPWFASLLGSLFHKMTRGMVVKADQAYSVGDNCASCGTCERICPRANIRLAGGKPHWSGNCQMCQACLQWCPQGAIRTRTGADDMPRSHNDGVTVADMLLR